MVQQIVALMNCACEELAANEVDVEQIVCLVDIAKGLLCCHWSFVTLDVHKLVVCQPKTHTLECVLVQVGFRD